jgi:hypothetical protein
MKGTPLYLTLAWKWMETEDADARNRAARVLTSFFGAIQRCLPASPLYRALADFIEGQDFLRIVSSRRVKPELVKWFEPMGARLARHRRVSREQIRQLWDGATKAEAVLKPARFHFVAIVVDELDPAMQQQIAADLLTQPSGEGISEILGAAPNFRRQFLGELRGLALKAPTDSVWKWLGDLLENGHLGGDFVADLLQNSAVWNTTSAQFVRFVRTSCENGLLQLNADLLTQLCRVPCQAVREFLDSQIAADAISPELLDIIPPELLGRKKGQPRSADDADGKVEMERLLDQLKDPSQRDDYLWILTEFVEERAPKWVDFSPEFEQLLNIIVSSRLTARQTERMCQACATLARARSAHAAVFNRFLRDNHISVSGWNIRASKSKGGYPGLENATVAMCYANAALQQVLRIPGIQWGLLKNDYSREADADLIREIQRMTVNLAFSSDPYLRHGRFVKEWTGLGTRGLPRTQQCSVLFILAFIAWLPGRLGNLFSFEFATIERPLGGSSSSSRRSEIDTRFYARLFQGHRSVSAVLDDFITPAPDGERRGQPIESFKLLLTSPSVFLIEVQRYSHRNARRAEQRFEYPLDLDLSKYRCISRGIQWRGTD